MKYLYAALIGALLILVSFIGGCRYDEDRAEAKAASVRAQDLQIALNMEPKLEHTLVVNHTVTQTLVQKVPYVVNHYIQQPGAVVQERPTYYLNRGAVSLWNGALGPASPADTDAAAPGAGGVDLLLSGVSFEQAETNAILNFGQYRDCRAIVAGWQDWYRQTSKVKP